VQFPCHAELSSDKILCDMQQLLNDQNFSDFVLQIKDTKFHLHRSVLAVRCPNLLEYSSDQLSYISTTIFTAAVEFIYTNFFNPKMQHTELIDLLFVAKKFDLIQLQLLCEQCIIENLNLETVVETINYSIERKVEKVVDWVIWYLVTNKSKLNEFEFQKLIPNLPTEVNSKLIMYGLNLSPLPEPPTITISLQPLYEIPKTLWETKQESDFVFKFKNNNIPAHKCILGLKWKYFTSILLRDKSHDIRIPLSSFQKLLKYFYYRDLTDITIDDAGYILASKEEYQLSDDMILMGYCEMVVNSQINNKNYYEALKMAVVVHNDELLTKILDVIE